MKLYTDLKTDSNVTIGYMIFSLVFSILFAFYFSDPMYFAFALFILTAIILATAIDIGDINKDLASIGWSSTNISTAIPLGILGGIAALILGGFIVSINAMHVLIPDMTAISRFFTTANIISPSLAVSANLFAQVFVVVPGEEALKMVIAPYAGLKIFKNKIIAFFIAIILWELYHVPTFIMQNVDSNMYIVLFILGIITVILFFLTQSILSPLIAHGTYNIIIILSSAVTNIYSTLTIASILIILLTVWLKNSQKKSGYHA